MEGSERKAAAMHDDHPHREVAPALPEVIGEKTRWWALAGFLLGAAAGCAIGLAFGYGWLQTTGVALLGAGGPPVPAFVLAVTLASLGGLTGGLLGTSSEARAAADSTHRDQDGRGVPPQHGTRALVRQLPIYGTLALVLFMAYTLYVIASRALGAGTASDQQNRVTWNQKNATRLGGTSDAETATYVLQTAYPATRAENRPRVVVTVPDDWRIALAATPLIARPTNAALIVSSPSGLDAESRREIARLGAADVESPPSNAPAEWASRVDERLASASGRFSADLILVSQDADYQWALPAGAYAARTGTPILFVGRSGVPAATAAALARRSGRARMFVLGPPAAVPGGTLTALRRYGSVTRIAGGSYAENAVRFAEFRDAGAGFGWGHDGRGPRRYASVNSILVNGNRWQDGVVAAHLARAGKSGALLLTGGSRLPPAVDDYLWRVRPRFSDTPAEGPYNQVWVVGSFDRISYGAQAWADYSQEIEQYMTLGDSAVSGFEALVIGWLVLSIASALWLVHHARTRLPDVMPMMVGAWAMFALLLGPVALVLYAKSYNHRPQMRRDGMAVWQRPVWAQVVSATVMMFGYDMMLMVLAVFLLAYRGFPIVQLDGPFFWLGSSMILMMVLMYLVAFVAMLLVFHTPMTMRERKITSYGRALLAGLPIMAGTMAAESVGMMPAMWWAQMSFLPGMQMPTDDDLTMWGTLLIAAVVGFVVVLPFNYVWVKRGRKMGMM